jgi:hypothetical protein
MQSSPATVDAHMVVALRTMMIAATLLACYLMSRRYELARLRDASELEPNG